MLIVYYLILPDVFYTEYVDCLLSDITCSVLYEGMLIVYYLILPDVFYMEYVDCLLSDITCCVPYGVC